jgi:sugar O-acyltransferase (sialic acid O-acetyltransferase NeuD family)
MRMNKSGLLLIGAGGHARSCIDVIEQQGYFKHIGLIGTPEQVSSKFFGYSVVGVDADLSKLIKKYQYALITVGQIETAAHRIRLFQQAALCGFEFPTIIAPTAHVSRYSTVGVGTIVMHGAIINAGVSVGNNCIVNSCALIEHDARVGDHSHISTGAILNGDVTVGSGSFIGSGSVIKQGVAIGKNCLVGMSVGVRDDVADSTQFMGYNKYE